MKIRSTRKWQQQ